MNTPRGRSLPNADSPCELDIHIRGQLFSRETVQMVINELLVPALAKQLLADGGAQQALTAIRTTPTLRFERTQRSNAHLLTVNEAAERLGIRPSTVRQWIWTRKIPMVKIGRCVRVPVEAVSRFIEANTVAAR
jgi:excisionase family DNA binding protein